MKQDKNGRGGEMKEGRVRREKWRLRQKCWRCQDSKANKVRVLVALNSEIKH